MIRYLYLEIKKLLHFPAYRYGIVFLFIILLISNVLFSVEKGPAIISSWGSLFSDSIGVMLFTSNLIVITISAQFVLTEYIERTAQMNIASGVNRIWFILAKCLALIVGTYLMILLGVIISLILSALVAIIRQNFAASQISFLHVLITLLLSPLRFLPYIFVTFLLSTLLRSAVFPLVSVIFYSLLGENMLVYLIGTSNQNIINFFPGYIASNIDKITVYKINLSPLLKPLEHTVDNSPAMPLNSLLILVTYCIILIGLSYYTFSKQNLSK